MTNLLYLVVPTALLVLVLWLVLLRPSKARVSAAQPSAEVEAAFAPRVAQVADVSTRVGAADPLPTLIDERVPVGAVAAPASRGAVASSRPSVPPGPVPAAPGSPQVASRLRKADATIAELRDRLARAEAEVSQREALLAAATAQIAGMPAPTDDTEDENTEIRTGPGAAAESVEGVDLDTVAKALLADDDESDVAVSELDLSDVAVSGLDLSDVAASGLDLSDVAVSGLDLSEPIAEIEDGPIIDVTVAEQAAPERPETESARPTSAAVIDLSGDAAPSHESAPMPVATAVQAPLDVEGLPSAEALVPLMGEIGRAMQATITDRDTTIERLNGEIARLTESKETIGAELEGLRSSLAEAGERLTATRAASDRAAEQLAQAEARSAELLRERDDTAQSADVARDRAALLGEELAMARERLLAAQTDVRMAEGRMTDLEEMIAHGKDELARAQSAIAAGEQERTELRAQLDDAHRRVVELEGERERLMSQLDGIRNRDQSVRDELIEARERLVSIESRIDAISDPT